MERCGGEWQGVEGGGGAQYPFLRLHLYNIGRYIIFFLFYRRYGKYFYI